MDLQLVPKSIGDLEWPWTA